MRQPHALEKVMPLAPPAEHGGLATLGHVPIRFGAEGVACHDDVLDPFHPNSYDSTTGTYSGPVPVDEHGVDGLYERSHRLPETRRGFVTASQLLTERRLEIAIDDPARGRQAPCQHRPQARALGSRVAENRRHAIASSLRQAVLVLRAAR